MGLVGLLDLLVKSVYQWAVRFIIIPITKGAPSSDVMVFTGSTIPCIESPDSKLHNPLMITPSSITAGSNMRWSEVRNNPRAICGTANPINPIGPQNAVIAPVSRQVHKTTKMRVGRSAIPDSSACSSPISSRFSGLIRYMLPNIATPITTAITGICAGDTTL